MTRAMRSRSAPAGIGGRLTDREAEAVAVIARDLVRVKSSHLPNVMRGSALRRGFQDPES